MTVPKDYGWNIYNKREDFSRMCGYQNNNFVESTINLNYEVCPTYPNIVFVPKGSEAQMTLIGSSKFRSKCRFPVLSYFYHGNSTCIIRCAQPLSGIGNKSIEDINLLKLFWQLKEPYKKLQIYDARPKINAMVNKAQGKGFEDLKDYYFCCFQFLDIPNIHVVRDSLAKYLDGDFMNDQILAVRSKHDSVSSLWQTINSSNWPSYIELIIQAAIKISSVLKDKTKIRVYIMMALIR
ncbi:hypothetical protein MXB_1440 [Myxobolus squamalis]|nr:hypothetical protein MXB_1440 [Myxobolus squamalis]